MAALSQCAGSLSYELLLRKSSTDEPSMAHPPTYADRLGEVDDACGALLRTDSRWSCISQVSTAAGGESSTDLEEFSCASSVAAVTLVSATPNVVAPSKASVVFLRNVSVNGPYADERVAALVRATRKLSEAAFDEDCLEQVTKKSHWKLTLLASEDLTTLCGYLVAKVVNGVFSIAKIAVPEEFRGYGFGRKIIEDATKELKKRNDIYEMALSSLAEAVPFYKRMGFKAHPGFKVTTEADIVEGQVFMDKKIRPRPRQRR